MERSRCTVSATAGITAAKPPLTRPAAPPRQRADARIWSASTEHLRARRFPSPELSEMKVPGGKATVSF